MELDFILTNASLVDRGYTMNLLLALIISVALETVADYVLY